MSLPEAAIDRVADYFRALSDPTRLRMLNALRATEHSVGELAVIARCSQANVSKHLRVLSDAGIISRTPQGTSTLIRITDPGIFELCNLVCGSVERGLVQDAALLQALTAARNTETE